MKAVNNQNNFAFVIIKYSRNVKYSVVLNHK